MGELAVKEPKHILILEDDNFFTNILTNSLKNKFTYEIFKSIKSYNEANHTRRPDVVLADYYLEDGLSTQIICDLKKSDRTIPIIGMSSSNTDNVWKDSMDHGVSDFYFKSSNSLSDLIIKLDLLKGMK